MILLVQVPCMGCKAPLSLNIPMVRAARSCCTNLSSILDKYDQEALMMMMMMMMTMTMNKKQDGRDHASW